MAQRSAPAPQGGALCRAVAPVLRAAASLRRMLAPPFRQRAAPPLPPAGRRVDVGASAVLRALPAAHSAAAAARARHWRARALPGFAGADRAARRAGRGSPPAIPRLHKPPQGLRARSGPRPPQARFARPCRALPPWCGAAAAGFPQPRPGSGRRAPSRAPSSPGFARAPCLFGAAARPAAPGLPCGFRRPKKAAADSRSRGFTPPPARPSRGGSAGWPPACFSLSVVIYSLRGERPPN